MNNKGKDRETDSPILFAGISEKYLQAAEIIWNSEFEGKNSFYWDKAIVLHPLSQLLGVSLETALKGLIVCRGGKPPRSHDVCKLLALLNDRSLEVSLEAGLQVIECPKDLLEANPDTDINELQTMYRRHHIHFDLIDQSYDRPFSSRYPILGGHSIPDVKALTIIIKILLDTLNAEKRNWKPTGST